MTTSPPRVLIVDGSVRGRRAITEILSAAGDFDVAGTAATGSIALQKIAQLAPDAIVVDVDSPEVGGEETVARIRATFPMLPLVPVSFSDETPDAIGREPSQFPKELTSRLRGLLSRRPPPPPGDRSSLPARQVSAIPRRSTPVNVLAIGSSTGGPNALTTIFEAIPLDLPTPILIAQHMPPMFTKMFAERLASRTGFKVVEATHGELIEPGVAYIAPGNFHLTVARGPGSEIRACVTQGPPENSCRPSVDVLFRSVAQTYGAGALAVVLTGMGQDGLRGSQHVVDAGGAIIVQDAATSVVASMPSSVAASVPVEAVYPIEAMGPALVARIRRVSRPSSLSLAPASVSVSVNVVIR